MKFTLAALLPAVLLTLAYFGLFGDHKPTDASAAWALVIVGFWVLTWCAIGVYWVGRIWRAATRDRRTY